MIGVFLYYTSISIIIIVLLGFLSNKFYFSGRTCRCKNRLDGKVVIVTGSNTGIGYETALEMVRRGAKVVMACRDLKKAQVACDKIVFATNSKNIVVERLDLASLDSIREFANNFKAKFNRLDVLINNAGLGFIPYSKTKDGFEMMFGTMHLGHFLLTGLLINLLKANGSARIINVSSLAHRAFNMNWDDLQCEKKYRPFAQYSRTKLANCLFTIELARKFKEYGITAVSVHPGYVRSDIFREVVSGSVRSFLYSLISPLIVTISKNCEQGAQTTIYCAVDDDIPKHNGKYFDNCQLGYSSAQARDPIAAKRLWDLSEKLVEISY